MVWNKECNGNFYSEVLYAKRRSQSKELISLIAARVQECGRTFPLEDKIVDSSLD